MRGSVVVVVVCERARKNILPAEKYIYFLISARAKSTYRKSLALKALIFAARSSNEISAEGKDAARATWSAAGSSANLCL